MRGIWIILLLLPGCISYRALETRSDGSTRAAWAIGPVFSPPATPEISATSQPASGRVGFSHKPTADPVRAATASVTWWTGAAGAAMIPIAGLLWWLSRSWRVAAMTAAVGVALIAVGRYLLSGPLLTVIVALTACGALLWLVWRFRFALRAVIPAIDNLPVEYQSTVLHNISTEAGGKQKSSIRKAKVSAVVERLRGPPRKR